MPSQPRLLTTTLVTYLDLEEEICVSGGKLDQFYKRMETEVRRIAVDMGLEIEHYSNSLYSLGGGINPDNSGRCAVCDEWVSAQNRSNIIRGLGMGVEHDQELYCLKHLPEGLDILFGHHSLEVVASSGDDKAREV